MYNGIFQYTMVNFKSTMVHIKNHGTFQMYHGTSKMYHDTSKCTFQIYYGTFYCTKLGITSIDLVISIKQGSSLSVYYDGITYFLC